ASRVVRLSHISVAGQIHCDAAALAGAEVGGVDQGAASSVQFRHEAVVKGELELARLDGMSGGKVGRTGEPRHVSGAGRVHSDAEAYVTLASAEVSGVDQGGPLGTQFRYKDIALSHNCV